MRAPQLVRGLDPEFRTEPAPHLLVDGKRISLPADGGQRTHPQTGKPLVHGASGTSRLDVDQHLRSPAQADLSLEPVFSGSGPNPVQPRGRDLRERSIQHVRKRRATPKPECLAQRRSTQS